MWTLVLVTCTTKLSSCAGVKRFEPSPYLQSVSRSDSVLELTCPINIPSQMRLEIWEHDLWFQAVQLTRCHLIQ